MSSQNITKYIDQFCGKIDDNLNKSIVVMQILVVNDNNTDVLGSFISDKIIPQIKILNNFITLDINYDNPLEEEYKALIELMELYKIIKQDKNIKIINMISLIENKEFSEEQIILIDPIFEEKCANVTGRPINGFRLAYDMNNVAIQEIEDATIKELFDE